MQAFLHWVQFTHVEISWCSTGLVIDVNFVALIKNVSLPFQTTIESVSCLVGLGWFFSVRLALRNSSLLELCLSADAQDLFQRCWNRSHFTAASAGVCGAGKMGQCCLQNPLRVFSRALSWASSSRMHQPRNAVGPPWQLHSLIDSTTGNETRGS